MALSRHHLSNRMLPGLLSVIVALAAAAESSATKPPEFVCPKINATHMCVCRSRNVTCDRLGISDISVIAPSSSIETLSASHNALRVLPGDFLHGAANLAKLSLSYNRIASIDPALFEKLSALVFLDLSFNELKEFYLPGNGLPRLKFLYLDYNFLISLRFDPDRPNDIFSELGLDGNNLTDLSGVFGYNKLEHLYLSQNQIQNNLNFIRNLVKLKHLTLGSNNISKIHYSVFPPKGALKNLQLNDNRLTDLEFLNGTQFLHVLNVTNNRIAKIPEQIFAKFYILDILILSHNNITDSSFLQSVNNYTISRLDLSHNKLSNINTRHVQDKTYLKCIDVSYNELSDINFAGSVKELKTLFANNNKISQINNTVFLYNKGNLISDLNLSNNLISNITFLIYLHRIINLNLSNNNIQNIHQDTMSQLKHLTLLDLSNNKIKDINFVNAVPNLITLNLSNNSVEQFPCNNFMQSAYLNDNRIANLNLNCAPRLRLIAMHGGVLRDRKEQELQISKEIELFINNDTIPFPCAPPMEVILKCKHSCNSEDAVSVMCGSQETIFTSPLAILIYCICLALCALLIVFIIVKYSRTRRRDVYFNRQCFCGKSENAHIHQSVVRNGW